MPVALLLVLLAGAPRPAIYFHTDGPALKRETVDLASGKGSGLVALKTLASETVRLPGHVIAFSQGTGDRQSEAVAVVCEAAPLATDEVRDCPVFLVDREGRARSLGVRALSAALVPGTDRFAFWNERLELKLRALEGGKEEVLARSVIEPRLSSDGRSFTAAFAKGLERFAPGASPCPARVDAKGLQIVDGACSATAPFLSPKGSALYVSTASGIAALYTAEPGKPAVQRTNVGLESADATRFVPVPGRELVWLSDSVALFTAKYAQDVLWTFDLESGRAQPLGLGREPALVDGAVVAVQGRGSAIRVVRVEAEVRR